MEWGTVVKRYAKYYDAIQIIGKKPLTDSISTEAKKDEIPHALVRAAYRDMKEESIKMHVLDFISGVAFLFLLYMIFVKGDGTNETLERVFSEYPFEVMAAMRPEHIPEDWLEKYPEINPEEAMKLHVLLFGVKSLLRFKEKNINPKYLATAKIFEERFGYDIELIQILWRARDGALETK